MKKTCTKCGEEKPLGLFYRRKTSRDGRQARCKTCVLARMAEYRARPEVKAHAAEYHAENRDRIREQQAEYYTERMASTPHVYWESAYTRRATEYGLEPIIESFTKEDLIERYGNKCFHCGGPFEELDHAPIPIAHGGEHTLDNAKPSCVPCNRSGGTIRRLNKKDVGKTA